MTVRIQTEDFDVSAAVAELNNGHTDSGATVTFTGLVRGQVGGKALRSMTLEHYPGMTEAELERIATEARQRWPLNGCLIIHRVGVLEPGAQIVLVATASPHRHAAFEAAAFIMDFLKSDAPFWKKEAFEDGSEAWVDCRSEDADAKARW